MRINITLAAKIPTVEYGNLTVGLDALDIDLDGDVEEQARACVQAGIKVIKILDDGLREEVSDIMLGSLEYGLSADTIREQGQSIARLERLLPGIISKVKGLSER